MAGSITSFFTSLFPSSRAPPSRQPTHLTPETRTTSGGPTPWPGAGASANENGGNENGSGSGQTPTAAPKPLPAAINDSATQQQIRDQRAQFLDKLSSGPARGKWKRHGKGNGNGNGSGSGTSGPRSIVQSQASS